MNTTDNRIDTTDKLMKIVELLVKGDTSRIAYCAVAEIMFQDHDDKELRKLKQYSLSLYPGPFKAEPLNTVVKSTVWLTEDDAVNLVVNILSQKGSPYYFSPKKNRFYHKMMVM